MEGVNSTGEYITSLRESDGHSYCHILSVFNIVQLLTNKLL